MPSTVPSAPAELVQYLLDSHHAFLHANMDRLADLASVVCDARQDEHPELLDLVVMFERFRCEMDMHLAHEETRVFPAIVAHLCSQPAGAPPVEMHTLVKWLDALEAEHDYQAADLDDLQILTDDFRAPEDADDDYRTLIAGLAELESDTREHVRVENEVLFPLVWALAAQEAEVASR